MELKLGKDPVRIDYRTIKLANILKEENLPPIPEEYDVHDDLNMTDDRMFLNDTYGDCVIAERAHQTLAYEKFEQDIIIPISDEDVKNEYFKETGGIDTGLVMLDSLNKWRKEGWTTARNLYNIHAFASIDWKNHEQAKQAIYLFNGVAFGMRVPNSAIDDFKSGNYLWEIKEDDGGLAGGHAVYALAYGNVEGYNEIGPVCITWGKRVQMTWDFWDKYVDEAYAIIDNKDDWVDPDKDPLDIEKLDKYLAKVTKEPVNPERGCFLWKALKRMVDPNIIYTPPTPEEYARMNWFSKAYYWFWHDVCHRPEPFTYTMRRSAWEHPFWWIITPVALIILLAVVFYFTTAYAWHISSKKKRTLILWIVIPCILAIIAWLLTVHLWGIW